MSRIKSAVVCLFVFLWKDPSCLKIVQKSQSHLLHQHIASQDLLPTPRLSSPAPSAPFQGTVDMAGSHLLPGQSSRRRTINIISPIAAHFMDEDNNCVRNYIVSFHNRPQRNEVGSNDTNNIPFSRCSSRRAPREEGA